MYNISLTKFIFHDSSVLFIDVYNLALKYTAVFVF